MYLAKTIRSYTDINKVYGRQGDKVSIINGAGHHPMILVKGENGECFSVEEKYLSAEKVEPERMVEVKPVVKGKRKSKTIF